MPTDPIDNPRSVAVAVEQLERFGLSSDVDALVEVASAKGNVGLSTGITGPTMSPVAEAMFVLNM